ncbi:heterokaryon incompatibility, partial [Parathielavia hyrcaniae]
LTEDSIRLLRVQKGWSTDDIICYLFESYPDQERGVAYKALSYTWGGLMHMPTAGLPKVLVDGYELELTENLYTSLGHIRCHDLDVTLWVDAICINQQDPKDKGHQVKQMGKVYAGADEVLIWLGQCSDTIHALLECIAWVDARATEAQAVGSRHDWRILCRRFVSLQLESENPSELRQALRELLQRPWFRRIW